MQTQTKTSLKAFITSKTTQANFSSFFVFFEITDYPFKTKICLSSSVMEFRLADFFSEKIIVGPHGVPDPPSLAQMTISQCTSMSELKIDPGAPPGGQI